VVGFYRHAVFDEVYGQHRMPPKQFVHEAFEVGREVLDDDERHARVLGQVVEEAHQRVQPAG
jgi:hypothetical protein